MWARLYQGLLRCLHADGEIDWRRASQDSASVPAKWGPATGPNPTDRGKPGTNRYLVTDARGTPLRLRLTAVNRHDSRQMAPPLAVIPPLGTAGAADRANAPTSCTPTRPTRPRRVARSAGRVGSSRTSPARGSRAAKSTAVTAGLWSATTLGSTAFAACPPATNAALTSTRPSTRRSQALPPASTHSNRSDGSVRRS